MNNLYNYYCEFEETYGTGSNTARKVVEYLSNNRYLLHKLFEATRDLPFHNYEDYRKFIISTYNHDMYSLVSDELQTNKEPRQCIDCGDTYESEHICLYDE